MNKKEFLELVVSKYPGRMISKNFKLEEIFKTREDRYKYFKVPSEDIVDNIEFSLQCSEDLRERTGLPMKITSFFRNEELNKIVGGAGASDHMKGLAEDVIFLGENNNFVAKKILGMKLPYIDKIIVYPKEYPVRLHISFAKNNKGRNIYLVK